MMPGWMRLALAGALLAVSALAAQAAAAVWTIQPEDSRVLFGYVRNGKPAEGIFTRFEGSGTFDEAAPGEATLEIRIDSASIDIGSRITNDFATSVEYFDSANHPLVIYRLLQLTPQGGDSYRAAGELTIRGFTRETDTMVTLRIDGDTAHAQGTLPVVRKDYHFGVGPTALFVSLGPEVEVRFDLTARRSP